MLHDRLLRPARVVVAKPRQHRRKRNNQDAHSLAMTEAQQEWALAADPYTTLGVKRTLNVRRHSEGLSRLREACTPI